MGFSLAAGSGVDASPAAADAMAGGLVGLKPQAGRGVRASALFSSLLALTCALGFVRTLSDGRGEKSKQSVGGCSSGSLTPVSSPLISWYSRRHCYLNGTLNLSEENRKKKIKMLFGYAYN
jgi:hypothetical protein